MRHKTLDHYESVAEELRLNGFDARIVITSEIEPVIECDVIAVRMKYSCSERTIMGDYYRFISHLGMRLHKWGLQQKIKEETK